MPRNDVPAIEAKLTGLGEHRSDLYRQLDEILAEITEAVGLGDRAGLTAYRMAKLLGMNESHVGTLRSAARAARTTTR